MNIRSLPFAAIEPLLAQHGIRLIVQSVDYATGHRGDARSDLWLGSANFYLPLEFSLFATLYELPLMQHCMNEDLAQDAALWRANRLPLAEFCQRRSATTSCTRCSTTGCSCTASAACAACR